MRYDRGRILTPGPYEAERSLREQPTQPQTRGEDYICPVCGAGPMTEAESARHSRRTGHADQYGRVTPPEDDDPLPHCAGCNRVSLTLDDDDLCPDCAENALICPVCLGTGIPSTGPVEGRCGSCHGTGQKPIQDERQE